MMRLHILLASLLSIAMVVLSMVAWSRAFRWSESATRPDVALWAVRSAAVALAAGAQAILTSTLLRSMYRRDLFSDLLRKLAGAVAAIALISAIALGLAGR